MECHMDQATTLTLREAAFVFGSDVKEIVRAVDEHSALSVSAALSGKRRMRLLGMPDLMYFEALIEVGELLTPKGRLELHEALLAAPNQASVSISKFQLPVAEIQHNVEKKLATLNRLKSRVEGNPDDPVIKGTSVEVYRIAALFEGGATLEEVKADYPQLADKQLNLAVEYARVVPKKGRPYPKQSFKRALENLNLDALDGLGDDAEGQK
jgi:uncharacterized protein (DUF433 family)